MPLLILQADEKPPFVICRAESEQMRQKIKVSLSEEIFYGTCFWQGGHGGGWQQCCRYAAPQSSGLGAHFHQLSATNKRCKWVCALRLHSECFLVANVAVCWLLVSSVAFPSPLCSQMKTPVLWDSEIGPEGLKLLPWSNQRVEGSVDHSGSHT